ncbi:hypothetical protein PHYPSEUDO_008305 [Phytophthora pseudosyringae]|uniref:Uncharacterized protein n=1 Tax=Phytophthora pseudosyringae TaxID=221518 RepID=A0A8T1VHF5_9STRA|nr:hypothetical protein PHYPSEUDO_008305 [Phytophthora pseudosyringae]
MAYKVADGSVVSDAASLKLPKDDDFIEDVQKGVLAAFSTQMKSAEPNHLEVYQEIVVDGSLVQLNPGDKIWYQLFAAGTRTALTAVISVPLPDWIGVDIFRDAVKAKHDLIHLKDVDASKLKVYKNVQMYGDPMKSSSTLAGCGMDKDHALIGEVLVSARMRTKGDSSQGDADESPAKRHRTDVATKW